MNILVEALIEWPRSVARHLAWLGPLFARIVTGWVFLWTGWGKLTHLPLVVQNFEGWGIPAPEILAPFASGVEFFGGLLLLVGLLTRICGGRARRRDDRRRGNRPVAGGRLVPDAGRARGNHVPRAVPVARHRRSRPGFRWITCWSGRPGPDTNSPSPPTDRFTRSAHRPDGTGVRGTAMKCEVCGNDYDKAFEVIQGGRRHVFDSMECAIQVIAPTCDYCGIRIIGHGMEADGKFYCCAHCAQSAGRPEMQDRVA